MKKLLILSIILSSLFGNSQCNLLQYGDIERPSEPVNFLMADPLDLNAWSWRNAAGTPDIFYRNWGNTQWSISKGIPFPFSTNPQQDCEVWNYNANNPDENSYFMGLGIWTNELNQYLSEAARGQFVAPLQTGMFNVNLKVKMHKMTDVTGVTCATYPITLFIGTSASANWVDDTQFSQFWTPNSPNYLSNIHTFQVNYSNNCEWFDINIPVQNVSPAQNYFYIGIQGAGISPYDSYLQYVLIDDIIVTQETNFQFSADVFCTDEDIDPSNVFGVDVISAESGGIDINDLQAGVHDLTITFLDDFGCEHVEIIQDVSFVNSTPVNINVTPSESVCPGTEINVSVDNMNNINWSSPADLAGSSSNSFDYLVGTDDVTFSVSGVDLNGCSTSGEIAIEVFPEIVVNANIVQAPCESGGLGSIYFQVYGGQAPYIYKWVQNGQVILYGEPLENFPPGTYVLAVMDANGCEFVQEYTISVEADFYYLEINNQDEADLLLSYTLLTIADQLVINVTSDQEDFIDINYSHITFGPYGKVVVKEGSKVRFINCTLTACADNWEGVKVEGSSSTSSESGFLGIPPLKHV